MTENKRLLVVFGVIAAFVIFVLVIAFWPKKDNTFMCDVKADDNYKKLGAVNYKQYECLYESNSANAIVYSDNFTAEKKKELEDVADEIGHAIYYLDLKNISSSELKKIKNQLNYGDNAFKKDVILVIKDSKVSGYKEDVLADSDATQDFLEESGLAKFAFGIESDEEYENLGDIDYEEYKKLYESDKPFAVILAQTTCGYCTKFKPVIDQYAADNHIPIYIIEIDLLDSEDVSALQSSLSYFEGNESWGTPLTLGIKNKEVVSTINGFTEDTSEIDSFFEKLGLK